MATSAKSKVLQFDTLGGIGGRVDTVNGIVRGVSLITGGIKARGHDLEVDDKTLEQVLELTTKAGKVPVKWNHKTGADAVNGFISDPFLDGNKVKADWHLLTTHSQYEQALELAERMPENVGLSLAFLGKEMVVKGTKRARCEEIISVDLVAQPAANPDGLFEAGVDNARGAKLMETPTPAVIAPAASAEPTLAELRDLIVAQNAAIDKLQEQLGALEAAGGQGELSDAELDQLAGLGDEELAKYDITREQIEAAQAARGEGGETPAGPVVKDAAAPTAAEVMAEMSDLRKHVTRLERKEASAEADAENAAVEKAFEIVERKVTELAARNDALEHALSQPNGAAMSPGGEIILLSGHGDEEKGKTEFDVAVDTLVAGGKKRTEAILLAQKESPTRYRKHLEAQGVQLKHL